jgi:hypothetical protein
MPLKSTWASPVVAPSNDAKSLETTRDAGAGIGGADRRAAAALIKSL